MVDLVALKDFLQPVFPLIGVAVGAVLTGFGQLYKARLERRRVIAIALSDLLEVRHRVVTMNAVLMYIQGQANVSSLAMPHLRNLFEQLLPADNKLDGRYNDALTLLAGMDPLFAFELRSKNTMPEFLARMRALATSAGEGIAEYESTETALIEVLTPAINQAVLLVAKQHSWSTYRRVKKLTDGKESVAERLAPLMDAIGATNRVASNTPGDTTQSASLPAAA